MDMDELEYDMRYAHQTSVQEGTVKPDVSQRSKCVNINLFPYDLLLKSRL